MVSKNNRKLIVDRSKNKLMKWSIRSLSIGVVSVAIGFGFIGGSTILHADEVPSEKVQAISDHNSNKNSEKLLIDHKPAILNNDLTKPSIKFEVQNQNRPEKNNASMVSENKTEVQTQTADAQPSRDVTSQITNGNVKLMGGKQTEVPQTVSPLNNELLRGSYSFELPERVNPNDSVTLSWSKNLNLYGVVKAGNVGAPNILTDDKLVIATGQYDKNSESIKYRFTNYVKNHQNITAKIEFPLYVDSTVVKNSSYQIFSLNLGKNQDNQKIYVNYKRNMGAAGKQNGGARVDEVDYRNHTVRQTIYVNPLKSTLSNEVVYARNQKVSETNKISNINYNNSDTKVRVYQLNNGKQLNESFDLNFDDLTDITNNVQISFDQNEMAVQMQPGTSNNTYVIQYVTSFGQGDIAPRVIMTGNLNNGQPDKLMWDNWIQLYSGNANGIGDQMQPGRFVEHHIYKTYLDDKLVSQQDETGVTQMGLPDAVYQTGKQEKDGFKFINSENPINNPTYKADGSETIGHFVSDETQEITYVYRKDKYTGGFQEHHIYNTYLDGKLTSSEEVDNPAERGTKDQTYETGKQDRDGFKFEKTENPINNPSYSPEGNMTEGHFAPEENQEITYVYRKDITTPVPEKPVEKPGHFIEHHEYKTYLDGKLVSDKTVDSAIQSGTKEDEYQTGKQEQDGFKFERVEKIVNNPTYKSDGSMTSGHFVPGETQEITYVYYKVIQTNETPVADNPNVEMNYHSNNDDLHNNFNVIEKDMSDTNISNLSSMEVQQDSKNKDNSVSSPTTQSTQLPQTSENQKNDLTIIGIVFGALSLIGIKVQRHRKD